MAASSRKTQTIDDIKNTLAQIKKPDTRAAMVRAMLRHGNITEDARHYLVTEYPNI